MPSPAVDTPSLLPDGMDAADAEEAVRWGWAHGWAVDTIAWKCGLPTEYVRLHVNRIRATLKDVGIDWKMERSEKLLALNQDLRRRLHDRVRAAKEKFSVNDVRELRELMLLEMKQLGLLAPEKFQQVGGTRTLEELIELCKIHGIAIPGDNYGPDPEPEPLPPRRATAEEVKP